MAEASAGGPPAKTPSALQQALLGFAAASVGASVDELTTLPIDIGKVRLQLQTPRADGTLPYRNMVQAGYRVGLDEGYHYA